MKKKIEDDFTDADRAMMEEISKNLGKIKNNLDKESVSINKMKKDISWLWLPLGFLAGVSIFTMYKAIPLLIEILKQITT